MINKIHSYFNTNVSETQEEKQRKVVFLHLLGHQNGAIHKASN